MQYLSKLIVSLFLLLSFVFAETWSPAYAYPSNSIPVLSPSLALITNYEDNNSSFYLTSFTPNDKITVINSSDSTNDLVFKAIRDYSKIAANFLGEASVNFIKEATGTVIGCYVLDTLATGLFPPAGILSAYCPFVGGAKATTERVITVLAE